MADIGESEEVKADLPGMIKPSFSQTGHHNRLDSVHSPTQPLPTFNLMVVYLILRLLLTRRTEAGERWGARLGGLRAAVRSQQSQGTRLTKSNQRGQR